MLTLPLKKTGVLPRPFCFHDSFVEVRGAWCVASGSGRLLSSVRFRRPCFAINKDGDQPTDLIGFYQSRKWQKLRAAILRRDKYMCRECRKYGRMREATTVHHIKHLEDFPELAYAPDNLISLCAACHNKQHPEKGGRKV